MLSDSSLDKTWEGVKEDHWGFVGTLVVTLHMLCVTAFRSCGGMTSVSVCA